MSEPKDIPPFISATKVQQINFGRPASAPGSPSPSITGHTDSPMELLMGSQKIREGIDLIAEGIAFEGIRISTTPRPTERKSDVLNQHRLGSEKKIPPFADNFNHSNPDSNFERDQHGPDNQPQQRPKLNESLLHQVKLSNQRLEQLAASNERNSGAITKLTEKLGDLKTNSVSFDGLLKFLEPNSRTLTRSARELVDAKPAFAGLIHLNDSSKYDNKPSVWQGITLHAQDRPLTVRVLMQNIQTAISNLHPDKATKGIELVEVFFVWDDNVKNEYRGDFNRIRYSRILGREEADESVQEDALVNDSLKAMMARDQGYIHVKYRLDKVEQAEWCGRERE